MSTLKSLSVAQYILDQCREAGHDAITPMQLIKLVYIAHGYMLGKHRRPLIGESVQAWQYGPVVASVYHAVKCFGSEPIKEVPGANKNSPFSSDERAIMDMVAKEYGKYNGITLSSATHCSGTPWDQTWSEIGRNGPISNDLIESFYEGILKKPVHSSL